MLRLCLKKIRKFSFGAWNMRTLVELERPIAISVARSGSSVAVDRKASFMVYPLKMKYLRHWVS